MGAAADTVNAFIAAIDRNDLDAALQYAAPGITYDNVPLATVQGVEAVRDVLGPFLGQATAVEFRIIRQAEQGNLVLNERLDRFELGGRWIELAVAGVFEVDDSGHIVLWRDYFDKGQFEAAMSPA